MCVLRLGSSLQMSALLQDADNKQGPPVTKSEQFVISDL